ncbi:MAG TPA: alpha/beta fold hydrolase, partial [Pyrinomonadaceae bacterium]
LGINVSPNIIFVPGVMGSLLSSQLGGIWWIDARTRNYINSLRLSADGQADATPENGITPVNVDITYLPFFAAVHKTEDFNYQSFPYDWRKPISSSADALRDLVNQLSAKRKGPVNLVAHSMGGLVVRAALLKHGDEMWPKINRIIFIGTPHYGSPAIAGYLKNHLWGFELMAILGMYLDRETLRTLWGVLNMLPAPRGIYPGTRDKDPKPWNGGQPEDPYLHPCANFDMYKADEWKLDLNAEQTANLQKILDATATFHRELHEAHMKLTQDQRDRMAVIVGVGYETLFRLAYEKKLWGLWSGTDKVKSRVEGDPHREGDGRVPLASAALEHVGQKRYVRGVHGELPMIRQVYEDVFRWLRGEDMQLPATPKGALEAHLGGLAGGNAAPHLTKVTTAKPGTGDPGLWSLDEPDQQQLEQLEQLKALVENEQLPAFNKIRLL